MPKPANSIHVKASPWKLGGLTKKQFAGKIWEGINADDVLGRAGQLAYFFFFAVFPLAIFLTALLGAFVGSNSSIVQDLATYLTRAMPSAAAELATGTIRHSLASSGGGKMTFGIIFTVLSASSGMGAMMDTLNTVFGVREGRSLLKQRAIALWLTIAVGILICTAISFVVVGGNIAHAVAGGSFYWAWQIVQYPVAIFFLLLSFSIVYYFAPNVEHPEWHWVTPGALVGVCLWIIVSFALRVYLHYFTSYTISYGALGAVMVLLLWFYVTGAAFLVGGEINAIIERAGTGQTKQREPRQKRPAGKIEREKESRRAEKEGKPREAA